MLQVCVDSQLKCTLVNASLLNTSAVHCTKHFTSMDISAEVTALMSDNDDNLVPLVPVISSSTEERKLSDVGCTSSDIKQAENGEIMPENVSDNNDANFCMKNNMCTVMCENNPVKPIEDEIITDCRNVDKDDNNCAHLDEVSGTNANTDGDDDDGEIADSRSQTPLQDELEPEVDALNQNQVAVTTNTELDPVVNPVHDCSVKTETDCTEMPECMSAAVHNSSEENGEVSDDDDENTIGNQIDVDSISQQLPVDVNPLEEEKPTKELESQKVFCMLCLFSHYAVLVQMVMVFAYSKKCNI